MKRQQQKHNKQYSTVSIIKQGNLLIHQKRYILIDAYKHKSRRRHKYISIRTDVRTSHWRKTLQFCRDIICQMEALHNKVLILITKHCQEIILSFEKKPLKIPKIYENNQKSVFKFRHKMITWHFLFELISTQSALRNWLLSHIWDVTWKSG